MRAKHLLSVAQLARPLMLSNSASTARQAEHAQRLVLASVAPTTWLLHCQLAASANPLVLSSAEGHLAR